MEICFVPDKDYGKFLRDAKLAEKHKGDIVSMNGQVLGQHDGIEFYTIGQRKGLNLTSVKPLYVIELDAERNRVIVGEEWALEKDSLSIERCNWIPFENPTESMEVSAKIRYNAPAVPATVYFKPNGEADIKLHVPQRAITPGQACVLYQDDLVLGGGWIMR